MKLMVALLAIFIFIFYASATINLSGTNGKALLDSLQEKTEQSPGQSDNWSWGAASSGPVDLGAMVQDFNVLAAEDRNSFNVATSEPSVFEDPWMGATSISGAGSGDSEGSDAYDQKGFGTNTKGIFDCTCFETQKTAEFPEPVEAKAW